MPFSRRAAEQLLRDIGAEQSFTREWYVSPECNVIVDSTGWVGKVYLNRTDPDDPFVRDNWRAVGSTVNSLRHFLQTVVPLMATKKGAKAQ